MTLSKIRVAVLDYGVGNIRSITNALIYLRMQVDVVDHASSALSKYDLVVVPGVGLFKEGMNGLKERGFVDVLNKFHENKTHMIIGICLGMQLFCLGSDESPDVNGLGWFKHYIKKFDLTNYRVPHVGWNKTFSENKFINNQYVYFVHSYALLGVHEDSYATTIYGNKFTSAIKLNRTVGFQFHPEKSQGVGLELLQNEILEGLC